MQNHSLKANQSPPYEHKSNSTLDAFVDAKMETLIDSKLARLLNDSEFLALLKEKLGVKNLPDEFIDIPTVCSLLNISRTTCHNRVKAGILIPYKTEGSRKVMFSHKQVLSTLKSANILKRKFL